MANKNVYYGLIAVLALAIVGGIITIATSLADIERLGLDTSKSTLTVGADKRSDTAADGGDYVQFSEQDSLELPPDPADNSNNLVVDSGCTSSTADCGQLINTILRQRTERPIKIVIGGGIAPNSSITFKTSVEMTSGISIEGINRPKLIFNTQNENVGGKLYKYLFWVQDEKIADLSFRGFDVDMQGCDGANRKVIFVERDAANFKNFHASYINASNGEANIDGQGEDGWQCDFFATEADGAEIFVHNNTADHLMRFFWAKELLGNERVSSTIKTLKFHNNTVSNLVKVGIGLDCYCDDVEIVGNKFINHAALARSGNFISTPLRLDAAAPQEHDIKITNFRVYDNSFESRPGIAFINKGNGASATQLAVRATKNFEVYNNTFKNGGESAIAVTSGSEDGIVRNNNIDSPDTIGIVLGDPGAIANPNRIKLAYTTLNVTVIDNTISNFGLDQADEFPNGMAAITGFNVSDSCVVGNKVVGRGGGSDYGAWVYNGPATYESMIVKNMHIASNSNVGVLSDFVQSDKPLATKSVIPIVDANPAGGSRWTAVYPGTDNDGDKLPAHCYGEDDNDKCAPVATDPIACRPF